MSTTHDKRIFWICLGILNIILLIIALLNFPWGMSYVGWDSITPESNIWINIRRAFTAMWQENYGVGLLGGHGFAATLPHSIIILFLMWLPEEAIRPFFTFLCLFIGVNGIYVLLHYVLSHVELHTRRFERLLPVIALIASLYYALNLGTVQMFYIQLEAFIIHFAALPWLFFTTIWYIRQPSRKKLFVLFVAHVFASGQGFIPPLFVAYSFAFAIFALLYLYFEREHWKMYLQRFVVVGVVFTVVNLYWLIPLGYYTVTRSDVYLNSYNNIMSTPDFISLNKKYGDIEDVPLIRGFIFQGAQLTKNNSLELVFKPWLDHLALPGVSLFGYTFFLLAVAGFIASFAYFKDSLTRSLSGVFLFFFTGLTTNFFPFSIVTSFLQNYMPIYRQAFRAAFTKFSIGVSFSYTIFLALGILALFLYLKRFKKMQYFAYGTVAILGISLLLFSFPTFQGKYLYGEAKLEIPKAYTDLAGFFADKGDIRIGELPQDCPEGWYHNNWGYIGSGFLWYSTEQPYLSRTFDVWSNYNENYYWELMQAIREEDVMAVDRLFAKYDVRYVVYDQSRLHCRTPKAYEPNREIFRELADLPNYEKRAEFKEGLQLPIYVFERTNTPLGYVSGLTNPKKVGPEFNWNEKDVAYREHGSYITVPENEYYYPFRSLFGKRRNGEFEAEITASASAITTSAALQDVNGVYINIPSYRETEQAIPVEISISNATGSATVSLTYMTPHIEVDGKRITPARRTIPVGSFTRAAELEYLLRVNNFETPVAVSTGSATTITTALNTNGNNEILLLNTGGTTDISWLSSTSIPHEQVVTQSQRLPVPENAQTLSVLVQKTVDDPRFGAAYFNDFQDKQPKPCNADQRENPLEYEVGFQGEDYIRLQETNQSSCIIYNETEMETKFSYLVELKSRTLQGEQPKFYVSNQKRVQYLDLFAGSDTRLASQWYMMPATFSNSSGYDFYYNTFSKNEDESINDFGGLGVYLYPYNYLKEITITSAQPNTGRTRRTQLEQHHPYETYYSVSLNGFEVDESGTESAYITLSQGFDPAWQAYVMSYDTSGFQRMVPFFFGKRLEGPVLVNNWKMGWNIPAATDTRNTLVVITYLPQYLHIGGFIALGVLALLLLVRVVQFFIEKRKRQTLQHTHTVHNHNSHTAHHIQRDEIDEPKLL